MGPSEAGIETRRHARLPAPLGALAAGEWIALLSGAVLLASLFTLPWFAVSASGVVSAGSEADAFRWLDGIDVVLLGVGLVAAGPPLLRLLGAGRRLPGDLAVAIAAAGIAAAALIVYRIIAPPEIDRDLAGAASGAGVTVRGGALAGLLAAVGIAVGGLASLRGALTARERPVPQPSPGIQPATQRPRPHPTSTADPSLASATVDHLRALGLSTTQARRVVRYRDELGIVATVADLDQVPGIPATLRAEVKAKLGG